MVKPIKSKGFPTAAEWEAVGDKGCDLVRKAIGQEALAMFETGKDSGLTIALGVGALVAAGEFLAGVTKPEARHIIEQWAIGYVRGAIRDAHTAVHDDGRPMEGTFDA